MPENFLVSASNASASKVSISQASDPVNKTSTEATPKRTFDRESLRILVIGSRQGVLGTIQTTIGCGLLRCMNGVRCYQALILEKS